MTTLLPSGKTIPWALGKSEVSRLYSHGPRLRVPTHHPVTSLPPEARLATGLPGSALAGRVSHPLDDFSEFHELPHVFIPFRPALPGRTVLARLPARPNRGQRLARTLSLLAPDILPVA
jgi:hypothetical protein